MRNFELTPVTAASYLGAMIDGEGSIDARRGSHYSMVTIYNTDPAIIAATEKAARLLGITSTTVAKAPDPKALTPRKTCWMIRIRGYDNLKIIHDQVPIAAPKKRRNLERYIDYAEDRPAYPKINKHQLESLYLIHQLNSIDIGLILGISSTQVLKTLRRLDIPIRSRGRPSGGITGSRRTKLERAIS